MDEILESLLEESNKIHKELKEIVEKILANNKSQPEDFERFGLLIDRIMGASKSLGYVKLGELCEKGKILGYKLSQVNAPAILNMAPPILMDLVIVLGDTLTKLKNEETEGERNEHIISRLEWLESKLVGITRGSVKL